MNKKTLICTIIFLVWFLQKRLRLTLSFYFGKQQYTETFILIKLYIEKVCEALMNELITQKEDRVLYIKERHRNKKLFDIFIYNISKELNSHLHDFRRKTEIIEKMKKEIEENNISFFIFPDAILQKLEKKNIFYYKQILFHSFTSSGFKLNFHDDFSNQDAKQYLATFFSK